MGKHRDVVEALIYYCNVYASSYKLEALKYGDVTFSFAQVQVIEYLLENEERNENMSAVAARLGITRSNFTKIVNRLVKKGLLEKLPMPGSHKEMKVTVNALGRELYGAYSQEILRCHFSPMFSCLDRIPEEYYPDIRNALFTAIRGERGEGEMPGGG